MPNKICQVVVNVSNIKKTDCYFKLEDSVYKWFSMMHHYEGVSIRRRANCSAHRSIFGRVKLLIKGDKACDAKR